MNYTHLAAFRAVAEEGSFVRGASRLLVGQPALSSHVADLEATLKVVLFERLPRGVRLTDAGRLLVGYARRLDALTEEAEESVAALRGLSVGKIRIGASTTVGAYLLPAIIGRFKQTYPAIDVTLDISNTADIQQRLLDAVVDLSVTEGFIDQPAFQAETIFHDQLVLIAPVDHPFAARSKSSTKRRVVGKITTKMLADQPFLLREPGSGTRAVVERALARKRVTLRKSMSIGSTEAIKQAVVAGLGIAIVSRMTIERELYTGALQMIEINDLSIDRAISLALIAGRPMSPAASAFLPLLRHTSPGMRI